MSRTQRNMIAIYIVPIPTTTSTTSCCSSAGNLWMVKSGQIVSGKLVHVHLLVEFNNALSILSNLDHLSFWSDPQPLT